MARRFGVELQVTRRLLQIGALCTRLGKFAAAEQILQAVAAYREDLPQPRSLLALSRLCQGRLPEAARELESVLSEFPNHQFGKALLGLVYRETGRSGWQQCLLDVIEDGRDEAAITLARVTLGDESAMQPGFVVEESAAQSCSVPHAQRVYG